MSKKATSLKTCTYGLKKVQKKREKNAKWIPPSVITLSLPTGFQQRRSHARTFGSNSNRRWKGFWLGLWDHGSGCEELREERRIIYQYDGQTPTSFMEMWEHTRFIKHCFLQTIEKKKAYNGNYSTIMVYTYGQAESFPKHQLWTPQHMHTITLHYHMSAPYLWNIYEIFIHTYVKICTCVIHNTENKFQCSSKPKPKTSDSL